MMEKIKAIIIEDESRAQIYLKGVVETNFDEIDIVAICDDLPSGVMAIRKQKPDLVFLDIEMPKYSGLEIGNFFNDDELDFGIIFTTAYNQYAIKAFKTAAIDYLLKPIDAEDLRMALQNFHKRRALTNRQLSQLKREIRNDAKIVIPDGNNLVMLPPDDILYLRADNSYTTVVLTSGKKHVTSRFLKNFEESLSGYPQFLRCHKSYIVNMDYVNGYNKADGGTVQLSNGVSVPVSPDKLNLLLARFTRVNR